MNQLNTVHDCMNQLNTVHDYYNNNCTSRHVPILLDQSCLQNYDYVTPRCTCLY